MGGHGRHELAGQYAQMMQVPFVIAAGSGFKGKTLEDLVEQIRSSPGKYNFASTGNGTLVHLGGQLFLNEIGGQAQHIPYAAGSEVAVALISGDVLFSVANISTVSPHFASGRIKGLATTGPQRYPLLAKVPTASESGVKDFAVRHYVGIFGPPGLPAEIATNSTAKSTRSCRSRECGRHSKRKAIWPRRSAGTLLPLR